MTEYWKSNAMYWCELCRCWMNDTKAAKLNHERGAKHQENLARKLRDMSKKADAEKKAQEESAAAIGDIEAAAAKAFEADQQAAQAAAGRWVWMEDSSYYYNAQHRWYYDPSSQWYYGGEPVAWTQKPGLPSAALFGTAPHEGGPVTQQAAAAAAAAAAEGASSGGAAASGSAAQAAAAAAAAATGQRVVVKKTVVQLATHPQSAIGGHQMPTSGRIGGVKGVGSSVEGGGDGGDAAKRKREAGAAAGKAGSSSSSRQKPSDPAEAEALARREAARRRVEERTKAAFGLS